MRPLSSCRQSRPLVLAATLILLSTALLSSACTQELTAPEPEPDPFVGLWVGSFVRVDGTDSGARTFKIIVRTGGGACGTGYRLFLEDEVLFSEQLMLDLMVDAEGTVTGDGCWYLEQVDSRYYYAEGVVTGSLNPDLLTGSGSFDVDTGEGIFSFDWQVVKEEQP